MRLRPFALAALSAALVFALPAEAQLGSIVNRAKREASKALEEMVEGAVTCAVNDDECVEEARKDGKDTVFVDEDGELITDANGNPITDPEEAARASEEPGDGVWRNYDYTPGRRVIYATDFSGERVGRFPARQLEFVGGNMQIVEMGGRRVLEATQGSVVRIQLPEALGDDFTAEIDFRSATANAAGSLYFTKDGNRADGHYVSMSRQPGIYSRDGGPQSSATDTSNPRGEIVSYRLQVDGEPDLDTDYAIFYAGSTRVAQVPNAKFPRSDVLELRITANSNYPAYLASITIAVGLDRLYDGLMETGEYVTRGIYFDVDSDVLRPESTPTLTEMVETLADHPEIALIIEGHTDSTGEDAHNLELSQRRAESVVRYLTDNGIDESRLQAMGKGAGDPVADNETAAGRQENRRVVLRLNSAE
ncbi:MAG: OmpA family protein [Acidobacteria bacterium]|nr:OmpA family protein [Acidobacteriota bacterium]